MNTKKNLVSFAKDLQTLLNKYPEILLSSDRDGNLIGYDMDFFNPTSIEYKADCKTILPTAAEPAPIIA